MVLNDDTRAVLLSGIKSDVQVFASALESIQDSGTVIFIDHNGYVYDPEGRIVFGVDGQPLRVQTKIIAKLNSLQNLKDVTGIGKLEYEVGGRPYLRDLPDGLKHIDQCPVAIRLTVESIEALQATSHVPAIREAAAKERAAVFEGLAALASAEGAAFATRVEAVSEGIVKVTTAAGKEIIGRVLGTYPLELGIEGAATAIGAAIQSDDGTISKIIAEGTATAVLNPED